MGAAEILNRAADIIETTGLAKGDYLNTETGCHCTVGALAHVINPADLFDTFMDSGTLGTLYGALSYLDDVLGLPGDVTEGRITDWNDAPGRTQAEVVDALRVAAKLAETVPGS